MSRALFAPQETRDSEKHPVTGYRPLALVVLLLVASIAGGCGGGSNKQPAPTKAQFIAQADAICRATDKRQEKEVYAPSKKVKNKKGQEELVLKYGIPPIEDEIGKLSRITPPSGDRAAIASILAQMEEAVAKAKKNPAAFIFGAGPFTSVEAPAKKYGFKDCSRPE